MHDPLAADSLVVVLGGRSVWVSVGTGRMGGGVWACVALCVAACVAWGQVDGATVPRCTDHDDTEAQTFCECKRTVGRSGHTINIVCIFGGTENVQLTAALYPFLGSPVVSAYVRVQGAQSVWVTRGFLAAWQGVPATALDLWYSGTITFDVLDDYVDPHMYSPYRTSIGIGIIGCNMPEIPAKFLRDRDRGALRIQYSNVGVVRAGALHNVKEMRYIVVEDSTVGVVEGPLGSGDSVRLSQRTLHPWTGLALVNVTLDHLAPGAFNLTHTVGVEGVEIRGCDVKEITTNAITVTGNLNVTIADNTFRHLQPKAIKVQVSGKVRFDGNVIESLEVGALGSLECPNRTSLSRNTVHVSGTQDRPFNTTPFHSSCGNPQIFTVVSASKAQELTGSTAAPWTLGVVAVVLVVVLVYGVFMYRRRGLTTRQYKHDTPIFLSECTVAVETIPTGDDMDSGNVAKGITNPGYDEIASAASEHGSDEQDDEQE